MSSDSRRLVLRRKRKAGTASLEEIQEHKQLESYRRVDLRRSNPAVRLKDKEAIKRSYAKHRDRRTQEMRTRWAGLDGDARAKSAAYGRQWAKDSGYYDRDTTKANKRAYRKQRYHSDAGFRLGLNLRNRCYSALKRGTKHSSLSKYLGCSIEELKIHLELKWLPGMSWDNYAYEGWHVDHVRPLASFDLADPAQFHQAFHYTNLQPLWAIDNLHKSDQWTSP